ncbi:hypothetical protein R4K19_22610 [Pseudomonas aeruginosa]|uniref:hypothetical protein n=1 Tax=Pseudomonas aeruginosa TaxID=287 RepID=UPI002953B082|nr:hypothetical protein [Pseudomonas aeruginosa]MDV8133804.1 hypothetical protein [Pseudomonas aeruginosa]
MLLFDELEIGSEARFVLQALVLLEPAFKSRCFRAKAVAKELCLTERLVRKGMQELADNGWMLSRLRADKVGRPLQEYAPSESLIDRGAGAGASEIPHRDLIVRLFTEPEIYAFGPCVGCTGGSCKGEEQEDKPARKRIRKDGRPAAPGAKGRLAVPTRVLLAALLKHADQVGVVTGASEKQLRAMTGLDPLSLKHQVRRLVSLGFIRSYVPGVSNGIFVKAKVPSIYYLNLDHPQLGGVSGARGLVVHIGHGDGKFDRLAAGIPSRGALAALGEAALTMLFHMLAGHTSRLLSAVWADPDETHSEVKAAIAADIREKVGGLPVRGPVKEKSYYWPEMPDVFHAAVCEWADSLHRSLRRWKVFQGYRPQMVRLIPGPDGKGGEIITSLVVYPAPRSAVTCVVVWDRRDGRVDSYGSEDDLDLEFRLSVGLLTKP